MDRGSAWPFPYLTFTSGDQSIIIESTKFALTWTFGDGEGEYPGYESLRDEIAARFSEFAATLNQELDIEPHVTASECQYYNEFSNESPARVIGYVLTNGSVDLGPETDLAEVDYNGYRRHSLIHVNDHEVEVVVGVDASEAEHRTVDLFIEAKYEFGEADAFGADGLDIAHEALIDTFIRCTRADQQERWGRVGEH